MQSVSFSQKAAFAFCVGGWTTYISIVFTKPCFVPSSCSHLVHANVARFLNVTAGKSRQNPALSRTQKS